MSVSAGYLAFLQRLEQTRHLGMLLGLDRLAAALEALGAPQRRLPAVHIAGTNGKGSTAAMTESILRASGLRTGLFTSPHLSRFTERFRITGREIAGERLAGLFTRVQSTGATLTYFEVATALAFLAFAEDVVEVAVLEVGLGGRLDATNLCRPVATAITGIGLEHTDVLGPTLTAIAGEKAGIAKRDVPLSLGDLPPEADREVARVAAAVGAPVARLGRDFADAPVAPRLPGPHQRANAALAVQLARTAAAALARALPDETIARGLREVSWPGRLEWLADDLLVDGAHNADGMVALLAALPDRRPRALVLSIVRGKAVAEMLAGAARAFDCLVFTRSQNPRALPAAELAAVLPGSSTVRSLVVEDPRQALDRARAEVGQGGLGVVAGSLFLVGEIRAHLLGEPADPVVGGDPLP